MSNNSAQPLNPILNLGPNEFLTGVSPSPHLQNAGVFASAPGITPFRNPTQGSVDTGLLQASPTFVTNVGSGTIVDAPIALAKQPTGSGKVFALGNAGHLYQYDAITYLNFSDKRSGTPITSPREGLFIFRATAGSDFLYYMQNTQIGRWDLAGAYPTGWTDNWATGLTNNIHAVHPFSKAVYYTNDNNIGSITDVSGTPTNTVNALILQPGFFATCIADDGQNITAGVTNNFADNRIQAISKIIFWDTQSLTWQKEWLIPDPYVIGMVRIGGSPNILIRGSYGLYICSYYNPPQYVRPLQSISASYPNSIISMFDGALFIDRDNNNLPIASYWGKVMPTAPNAYFQLFNVPNQSSSLTLTLLDTDAPAGFLVGNGNDAGGGAVNRLLRYRFSDAGTTGAIADTIYFDFPSNMQINRADVIFGDALATGDSLKVDFITAESDAALTGQSQTITYATEGAIRYKRTFPNFITNQLKLRLTFQGGNPKVRRLIVYGYPVNS